ncbi:MAG: phosphoribosylformylglycinamidine synthase subunit PurL, partial [Terriglobia bacterium]
MSQKYRELGLVKSEYEQIREALGRDPTFTELSMYAVMWSEHCSYKSSRPVLKDLPSSGKGVLQGPGENAGLVDIGGGLAVALKIESHNHPSAIEPYQGAATGVGGIIRDIFTMGARPVAILDSLRFGRLSDEKVRYLFDQVVAGIAGYGNCIGVPTVGGEIYFADSYEKNPLVNAMAVGVVEKDRVIKGIAPIDGDSAILFGSKTGRDGIHGVTFASEELSDRSVKKRPAVQIADPFTEKLLIEACLELNEMNLLRGLQDLGGGGLTCASSEMAAKGDSGMELDVSMVDRREEGMDPFEVMLSESQERMLAVVAPEDEARVLGVCRKWGLEAAVVGKVTKTGSLTIKSDGSIVAEVPAKSLTDGPVLERTAKEPAYLKQVPEVDAGALDIPHDLSETVLSLLRSENLGRKNMVYEQYDYDVGTKTVAGPGQGAALLKIGEAGLAMTVDGNGRYCFLDPFEGARIAVAEAARNLACVGARPVALTNCLNYGSPENPEVFWQFKEGVRGMSEAAVAFGVPIVSGNVSFYNEVEGSPIYP